MQVGGGPAGHAVEVGGELSAGKGREGGQRYGERLRHGAADLDHRIERDGRCGPGEVRTEAREPSYEPLPGGKPHGVTAGRGAERMAARQFLPIWRIISGYTIRCRNGAIAAM